MQAAWAEPSSRRKFVRKSVLLCGTIHRGEKAVDCVVTNVSANGARLIAQESPDGDALAALKINRCGMFPAEIAWQDGDQIGVRFLDAPATILDLLRRSLPHCKLDYEMAAV